MRFISSLTILLCGLLKLGQPVAFGALVAMSDARISNLGVNVDPARGTVVFSDPWSSEAFAQAQNSLGELDQQFDFTLGGMASANGIATFANGHGDANALSLTARSTGNASISGGTDATASSVGNGTLSNSFTITRKPGVTDPTINVTFSLGMIGALQALTDGFGCLAETSLNVNLLVDGNPVLFYTDSISIGFNDSQARSVSQTLTQALTLQYDTSFFLLTRTDSEVRVKGIPEPSNALMGSMLLGVIALSTFRRPRTAQRVSP